MSTYDAKTAGFVWILSSENEDDIEITGNTGVGREDEADICIPDWRVSRKHASISVTLSGLLVTDLSSANGTLINGVKITEPTLIKEGDTLGFYAREFKVEKQKVASDLNMLLRSDTFGEFELAGEMIVGRDESCDLCIPEELISRRHAKIKSTYLGLIIEDFGSANGTFVNGTKITKPTKLIAGDHIKFCDKVFHVAKKVDPDATRIAGSMADPDATYVMGADQVAPAAKKPARASGAKKAKANPASSAVANDAEEHIRVEEPAEAVKPSAIERQKRIQKYNGLSLINKLAEGIWLELKISAEDSAIYRVRSIDIKTGEYLFVPKTTFGLSKLKPVKKSREQVIRDLSFGEIAIIGIKRPKRGHKTLVKNKASV